MSNGRVHLERQHLQKEDWHSEFVSGLVPSLIGLH